MAYDAYNQCGGSVYRLSNGHYLAAFTASTTLGGGREHDTDLVRTTYAWEIDVDGSDDGTPTIIASMKIPIPHSTAGDQNAYRLTPWSTVFGESTEDPLS